MTVSAYARTAFYGASERCDLKDLSFFMSLVNVCARMVQTAIGTRRVKAAAKVHQRYVIIYIQS